MNTINHGDRAFPVPADYHEKGMTLRDYFAAKALQSLITKWDGLSGAQIPPVISKASYAFADAMLAERAK